MSIIAKRLGLVAPIFQAPMAGSQGHALAAAVCNAGGLGSLPAAVFSKPDALLREVESLRSNLKGTKPFNLNFFAHTPPLEDPTKLDAWQMQLEQYYMETGFDPSLMPRGAGRAPFSADFAEVVELIRPAVVSFHFGLPEQDLLHRVKATGALVVSSATTPAEAQWLEAKGVDAIVAQGVEAGGHRGMFLSDDLDDQYALDKLLKAIVGVVHVPVIAAGGIGCAEDVKRVQALGADGVQLGTAYLCTSEATTCAVHRAALQSERLSDTALTNLFTGRPARGIVNRLMRERGPLSPTVPQFPLATAALAPLRSAAEKQDKDDFTPLWAGQHKLHPSTESASTVTARFVDAWLQGNKLQ